MAEEIGDGLEIQDNAQKPQEKPATENQAGEATQEADAESPQTPAESKPNKVKAFLDEIKAKAQPFVQQVKENKILMIGLIAAVALFFILLILLIIFALMGSPKKEEASPAPTSRKIVQPAPILGDQKRPKVDDAELGNMIKKANILYTQGDKLEALEIFKNIATYLQSLAYYNLGVIKLKEGDYKGAISSFDGAINAGEDISVSAFDAAYSAYMLGDVNLYEYYLGISSSYLYYAANQPLYSYLYGLLQYYKGFYFEALSPFLNPNSQSYSNESKKLASEMFLVFGDEYNALAQLKQAATKEDNFAIALLHARLGEYAQAKQYLYEYLGAYVGDPQALMALQLIELKSGNYKEGALILDRLNAKEDDAKVFDVYPIKAKLRDDLFDIHLAQENFWNRRFEHNKMLGYKLLFYYAPFLVFDAKRALAIIDDGNLNAYSSNIESAKSILQEGQKVSQINSALAQDLRSLLLNQDIRDSIKSMEKSLQDYPNHSVLHYDVGLLYAQMSDFDNAYLHFIRAYHLDSNNTMAGIFALMCAELTYRDVARLRNSISNDLAEITFNNPIERQFLSSLFRYAGDNPSGSLEWLNEVQKQPVAQRKPIYYALQAVYAISSNNEEQLVSAFERLKKMYVKDVVANTMYELSKRFRVNLRDVALQMNAIYKEKDLDMRSIYYGPSLARELYIYVGFVTGSLRSIQEELEARLIVETRTNNGILQALAYSNIYSNDFEKAFALYNSLLDDLHEDDSQTRFLAAIAAMGAHRHENAVALLQLTKTESATNFEARYALGLLYQEIKNMKAATQHYDKLSNTKFESEFFDFEIDTSYLLDTDKDQSQAPSEG